MPKLRRTCNVSYTDSETGKEQYCRQNPPNQATRGRLGAYVCDACWPHLKAAYQAKYGRYGAQATALAFRRV